jgi:phenylacetaldehyde dehydrogenase
MPKDILYHDLSAMRDDVRHFLDAPKGLLIGGEVIEKASGGMIPSEDPGLEVTLAEVPSAWMAEVDAAVDAARQALDGAWGRMVPAGRAACMHRLAELIYQNLDQLAELEGLDTGKPAHIARALDIPFAAEVFKYNAGWATKLSGRTFDLSLNPEQFHTYTRTEPVGVVAAIYAWNYPFAQAAFKLAPALASGCTVILKPAEQTPLTTLRLAQLVTEAGFPPGTVNVLTGYGHTVGAALARHPGVDKVSFTGSTEVGRSIAAGAAQSNFKRLTLEMGGKSPTVIFADADLDRAIPAAAGAIFGNSGQVCNAGSRLLVDAKIHDQVIEGIAKIGADLQLGCALNGESQLGPLMSARQLSRVSGMVEAARKAGVEVVSGGARSGERGYFFAPTVLANVDPTLPIARDEIFGPVLCTMTFKDEGEALTKANDTAFGLAASIWTRDSARAHRMANGVKAGAVWLNAFGVFDPNLPFGGYKQSGWGREFGIEGVEAFRETKAISLHIGA